MNKVLIIVGPTGVGKTEFSLDLAKKYNSSIISGDSIQVYKGLDIGSAKIKDTKGIIHHGIDILDNKDKYSVADFQKLVRNIIENNSFSMIVGGTGFYIKACIYDYEFNEENTDYSIYEEYNDKSNEELYELLKEVDIESTEKIHVNNRKRIIRALIINRQGVSKSDLEKSQKHELIYDVFIVGCTMPREIIYERINQRVLMMIDDGLENEVKSLLNSGVTFDDLSMQGIGYKEWKDYFSGDIDINEVIRLIQRNSRNFAKRQYTWFNNQMDVNWVNMLDEKEIDDLKIRIDQWIKD